MIPAFFASWREASEAPAAVPPMWNVRLVSASPPIDWAAITPTASPSRPSGRWPG